MQMNEPAVQPIQVRKLNRLEDTVARQLQTFRKGRKVKGEGQNRSSGRNEETHKLNKY